MNLKVIGYNIRQLRKAKNMTQKELAAKIGWSRQQLIRYEHGDVTRANYEFLMAVASELGVSIEYLNTDHREEKNNV